MSIFGERIRRPGPDIGTILSDYVKKDYVDTQDGTISEALKHFKAQLVSDLSDYVKKDYVDTQDGTISEALKHFKAQLVSDLSDYAKKDYVDAQDGLRVLKAGDTMSGDLDMGGQLVRGLPRDLRPYKGDEATSWNQVVRTAADAFEAAVDRRKPMITVWAEQKRSMLDNRYEWSFGSDAARGLADGGYPMMAAGRVLRMGLSTTAPHNLISSALVNISVNGMENPLYGTIKPPGQACGISIFSTPLALQQGDKINFRSASSTPEIASAVVSLLIELDL